MNPNTRRKIKKAILDELRISSHPYQHTSDDTISERILDEIEVILKNEHPHLDFSKGKLPLTEEEKAQMITDADSSGAQRAARTLP